MDHSTTTTTEQQTVGTLRLRADEQLPPAPNSSVYDQLDKNGVSHPLSRLSPSNQLLSFCLLSIAAVLSWFVLILVATVVCREECYLKGEGSGICRSGVFMA